MHEPISLATLRVAIDPERLALLGDDLRAAGLRATRPRELLYSILKAIGGHRSVDDLLGLLAQVDETLPRMSAYNVIADLERVGLVRRSGAGGSRAVLYEVKADNHHHFVCRSCQAVFDIPADTPPAIPDEHHLPGLIEESEIIYRGLCRDCVAIETAANDE